eukprot:scaffold14771_cov79-Cyclotella_meneghiniana.AAC.1
MNFVFANTQVEESIYPLTVSEIAEAQKEDADLKQLAKADKYEKKLVEDITVYCKDDKLVIPKTLQRRAVEWYHHYLQHPGSTRLEETLRGSMYWKGMRRTVRAYVKNCKKCQVNKRRQKKYDIHVVEILSMTTVVNSSFTSSPYATPLDSNVSRPVSRILKRTQY